MNHPHLTIPTVDDWWKLSASYPQFRKPSRTPLKDYGYMDVLRAIERLQPKRMLEFGHGLDHLNDSTLYQLGEKIEFWAVDDYQGLAYYPARPDWEVAYEKFKAKHRHVRFVRGLLGNPEGLQPAIPQNYFDLIFSVSVLEELKLEPVSKIVRHCFALLAPGGHLVFSHDLRLGEQKRLRRVLRVLHQAGFEIRVRWKDQWFPDWKHALLENQLMVMIYYQGEDPQDERRRYGGNWTTFVADAVKPA